MRTKKKDALVAFKPCPKCHGAGVTPCDGMELYRAEHKAWAESYHLMPVIYKGVPGLAVKNLLPGGWHQVKIYIAVREKSSGDFSVFDGFAYRLDSDGIPHSAFKVQGIDLYAFDIINGKALWFTVCQWLYRHELRLLDHWPIEIEELRRLTAGGQLITVASSASI